MRGKLSFFSTNEHDSKLQVRLEKRDCASPSKAIRRKFDSRLPHCPIDRDRTEVAELGAAARTFSGFLRMPFTKWRNKQFLRNVV